MNLSNVLEYETRRPEFTLIESKATDGSFLVHHLLNTIIRDTSAPPSLTFLLTFSQTLSHYKSIQGKLGNSSLVANALSTSTLIPLDLMTRLSTSSSDNFASIFDSTLSQMRSKLSKESRNIYVIIDDLSIAWLIGVDNNVILKFLSRIRSLVDSLSLIIYMQSFDANKWLINDLIHMTDLYIRTESLSTGYSKEVDGQVFSYSLTLFN